MCVRGYQFYLCFYDFSIRYWNCSDDVVSFVCQYIQQNNHLTVIQLTKMCSLLFFFVFTFFLSGC